MAVAGLISVSQTVVNQGQKISCRAVLTNSAAGTVVGVIRVTPFVTTSSGTPSFGAGNAVLPIGQSTLLGASASVTTALSFPFDVTLNTPPAPQNPPFPSSPAYDQFTIGFNADMSDGTTVTSSLVVFVYPLVQDSTLVLTPMPRPGQLWFYSNPESALAAVSALH